MTAGMAGALSATCGPGLVMVGLFVKWHVTTGPFVVCFMWSTADPCMNQIWQTTSGPPKERTVIFPVSGQSMSDLCAELGQTNVGKLSIWTTG